jgi:ATP-binding cassette subfamily B protein
MFFRGHLVFRLLRKSRDDATVNERSMDDKNPDPLTHSLRQTRGAFIRTSALLFCQALLIVGTPYLLMEFFNHLTLGTPTLVPQPVLRGLTDFGLTLFQAEAFAYAALLIALSVVLAWLSKLEETSPLSTALAAMSLWRQSLLKQLLRGRLSYFETHSASDLTSRLSDDSLIVESLLVSSLKAFSKSLPVLLLMLAALVYNSPVLALAFFITVLPFSVVAASFVRADWVRSKRSDLETAHYRHEIQHSLHLLSSLKALSVEDEVLASLELRSQRSDEQALLSRRARGSLAGSVVVAKHVLRAALLVFGAYFMVQGDFHIGPFLMFALYTELMPAAVIELARWVALTRTAAPALERLRGLAASLENEEEREGGRKTSPLPFPDAGVLSFEGVSFAPGMPAFDADFEPGELIAVVGTQLSGRSTFGRLLNRLNDPMTGSISIGRTGLKSFGLELLRQTVTLVDRTPYFLTASVRDNLALAIERETDLDERTVNEALHSAGVDFITDLPDKLETIIGETAYRLSEGELQRLGVARALLRSSTRIYFFDEVTSGLEASEARTIFEAAQSLAESGALVFWVTRRADEANECDRIVYLEQKGGTSAKALIEVHIDTPQSLMARSDGYRQVLGLREVRVSHPSAYPPATPKSNAGTRGAEPTL